MRAVAVTPEGPALVDKPDPVPTAGEVVVEVDCCGICGSDLRLLRSGLVPPGAVLGHELAGTVVTADPAGGGPEVGTPVAVLPSRRCGACEPCRNGRSNLCANQAGTAIGLGIRDGGWAERVAVPAWSCHPLPPSMGAGRGALVEPYAVALHGVGRSRVAADTDAAILVVGAGSVGLMCVSALRRAGVTRLAVAEPRPARAAAAEAMGAMVADSAPAAVRMLERPPDVVFEAAGTAATPALAVEVAATGGEVVLLGAVAPGETVALPALLWLVKEVDVRPSIAYSDEEFAAAVDAVAEGAADGVLAAADRRPLDQAPAALADLVRRNGPVKVLLTPSG